MVLMGFTSSITLSTQISISEYVCEASSDEKDLEAGRLNREGRLIGKTRSKSLGIGIAQAAELALQT